MVNLGTHLYFKYDTRFNYSKYVQILYRSNSPARVMPKVQQSCIRHSGQYRTLVHTRTIVAHIERVLNWLLIRPADHWPIGQQSLYPFQLLTLCFYLYLFTCNTLSYPFYISPLSVYTGQVHQLLPAGHPKLFYYKPIIIVFFIHSRFLNLEYNLLLRNLHAHAHRTFAIHDHCLRYLPVSKM